MLIINLKTLSYVYKLIIKLEKKLSKTKYILQVLLKVETISIELLSLSQNHKH